ncbi:nuclease harbi1-like protein [Plakobranchus ocellatus]|uniref:Nuclease harbi1-like protein n=1 Tax=Plakobranchus ocellatus TaxID=259542 RepID=A0AAV4CVV9_9GAST|nr:nuclease harbi1-like protein [Plakobranchus ocellatus]
MIVCVIAKSGPFLPSMCKKYIYNTLVKGFESLSGCVFEHFFFHSRYLASGTSFQHIVYNYRVSHNHTGFIVEETCRAIWERLKPLCLPIPDRDTWERISNEYCRLWNFPNFVGSIDETHQEIQCPKNAGSLYFNYKDNHSLVVQAVADANYNFVVLDIGDYGRNCDGSVFRESAFDQDFENNRLDLPPPKALPNTDQELPFVFLADEAYPLRENLLPPYARRSLSNPSRIFNARLSRARKKKFEYCSDHFSVQSSRPLSLYKLHMPYTILLDNAKVHRCKQTQKILSTTTLPVLGLLSIVECTLFGLKKFVTASETTSCLMKAVYLGLRQSTLFKQIKDFYLVHLLFF